MRLQRDPQFIDNNDWLDKPVAREPFMKRFPLVKDQENIQTTKYDNNFLNQRMSIQYW